MEQIDLLITKLNEGLSEVEEALVAGVASDHASYQRLVGRREGLVISINTAREAIGEDPDADILDD